MQILFLALGISVIVLINSTKTKILVDMFGAMNLVVMSGVKYVCALMPVIVYLSIAQVILSGKFTQILASWKIVVALAMVLLTEGVVYTIYHIVVLKRSLRDIIKATLPIGVIGFSTCSSTACIDKVIEVCKDFYGVDTGRTSFCYSLLQMFDKISIVSRLVIFVYFMCDAVGIQMSLATIVINVLIFSLMAISIAPVAGGDIPVVVVLAKSVGLPIETVALYTTLSFIILRISGGLKTFTAASEIAVLDKKLNAMER